MTEKEVFASACSVLQLAVSNLPRHNLFKKGEGLNLHVLAWPCLVPLYRQQEESFHLHSRYEQFTALGEGGGGWGGEKAKNSLESHTLPAVT